MTEKPRFHYRLSTKRLASGEIQPDCNVEWDGEGEPSPEMTDKFLLVQADFQNKVQKMYPPLDPLAKKSGAKND